MELNQLAKTMRERALLIEGNQTLAKSLSVDPSAVAKAKENKRKQVEDLKKLYFNAGRWAGGARDQKAREAFMAIQERDSNAAN
jgi:hypothetical protein